MSKIGLVYRFAKGEFAEAMKDIERPIARAGTLAIREAGNAAKEEGRASIATAGFSRRWQNTLRADIYPKKGESMRAAAHIFHKIPYAGVFEDGETISGRPMLWLPLPGVPKKLARKVLTPERFATEIGDLISWNRRGRRPLLMARMKVSKAEAQAGPPYKIRMSALIRGGGGPSSGRSAIVLVPVYIGVASVKIAKKFNVTAAVEAALADLPALYLKHLDPEA